MIFIRILYIIFILILGKCIIRILWNFYKEYKGFNKGVCPKCGKQLEHYATHTHGGRGYCCYSCRYHTWVTYHWIDKY